MKHIFLSACLLFAVGVQAQSNPQTVYHYVERMPEAGYDYTKYINEHIHYPDSARANNIEGRVAVKFLVNEDGSISDCTVSRGIGGGCDEEALRVVRSFPPWRPGMNEGKAVKVYFTMPIVFQLSDENKKTKAKGNSDVFSYVEQMPVPGYDYHDFIMKNMHFPDSANIKKIEGRRVIVKFVVNEDGSISDCKVVRGIGSGFDEEVLKVVKSFPKWQPGKQNGKPVKVYYTLPIIFELTD